MRLKFLIVFFLTKSILINGQVSMDLTKIQQMLITLMILLSYTVQQKH